MSDGFKSIRATGSSEVATNASGALVGTIVGAVVGGEHWQHVEPPVRVALFPESHGRLALGLSVSL